MDALQRSNEDWNRLFNITEVLSQCNRYQQMYIYMCTILAYLRDSLIWGKLPYIQWTMWMKPQQMCCHLTYSQWKIWEIMLKYIESELHLMMHLPLSSDNILHFHYYLSTHVLIADRLFLLLIDMSIQNRAQQLQIYEIFSLPVPHGNLSAE